jgi:hypothetical protein
MIKACSKGLSVSVEVEDIDYLKGEFKAALKRAFYFRFINKNEGDIRNMENSKGVCSWLREGAYTIGS